MEYRSCLCRRNQNGPKLSDYGGKIAGRTPVRRRANIIPVTAHDYPEGVENLTVSRRTVTALAASLEITGAPALFSQVIIASV